MGIERWCGLSLRPPCWQPHLGSIWPRTGKGFAQGRDDERGGAQVEVCPMRAGVLGEGPHKLHPRGLGRDAGADQRGTALLLHRRGHILYRPHVEPTRRSILTLWQPDRLARDGCTPFKGLTLLEELLPGDGLGRRDARC